jgi:hypothetical protein
MLEYLETSGKNTTVTVCQITINFTNTFVSQTLYQHTHSFSNSDFSTQHVFRCFVLSQIHFVHKYTSQLQQDGQGASLNLSKVAGIFYILIGGMIVAMVAAMGELLYRSRIEARKGKVTPVALLWFGHAPSPTASGLLRFSLYPTLTIISQMPIR